MSRAKKPAPKRIGRDADAERLLAEIASDPTDDHARQVYADLLIERGDPRGTFISMQLRPSGRDPEAELALLKKHSKPWLGPLAAVVSPQLGIGRDFLDRRTLFDRGFVSHCTIASARPRLGALSTATVMATVEHLGVPRSKSHKLFLDMFEKFLSTAPLLALRSLEVTAAMLPAVLADPIAARLEALWITGSTPEAFVRAAKARLSAVRTLGFRLDGVVADKVTFRAVELALARPSLERLELEVYQARASYRRVDERWTVQLAEVRGGQMAKRLELLAG